MQGNGESKVSSLKGRVALVTGAARGIGRAISLALACRGAAVAVNYRASTDAAESLAREIEELGAECLLVQGNVAQKDEARAVVRRVLDHWKRLDVLVNNAGITKDRAAVPKIGEDECWTEIINVNLNGTYYCTSAALPAMVEQNYGRIINISSYLGQGGASFAASEGGIIAFTKAVALEVARSNITANAVAPGFTSTEMMASIPSNLLEQIKEKIPMGRLGMPEEIAKAVVFLAAEGDYITGQQLNVNGGVYL